MNDENLQGVPAHRVRHVVRKVAAVSLVTALSFLLAGCTVPIVGVAGIGVDDKGAPVGYLQVCQDHLDGATVYTDGKDDDQGSWKASSAVTDFARWSLTDPGEGWTPERGLGQLKPGVYYSLYGWTKDNSSSAASVMFRTSWTSWTSSRAKSCTHPARPTQPGPKTFRLSAARASSVPARAKGSVELVLGREVSRTTIHHRTGDTR